MRRRLKIMAGIILGAIAGLFTAYSLLRFIIYEQIEWHNADYIYYSSYDETLNDSDAIPKAPAAPTGIYARYAALADASTGLVLYSKNGDTKAPMASTTKIMTCILALEILPDDYKCISSKYASTMPDVQMDLIAGEEFQINDLLYALMLRSYNDSAVVIAENAAFYYLSKNHDVNSALYEKVSKEGIDKIDTATSKELVHIFAALMNEKAAELGCTDTYFITPNGLDAQDETGIHSTTPVDLCKIMSYCIKNEAFLKITQASSYSFKSSKHSYSFTNANTFFQMMDGVISGKTGFTNDAGYCYVCALENGGRTYVSAVLASGWPGNKTYKWLDTKKIMKFGMDNYFLTDLTSSIPMPSIVTITGEKETFGLSEKYSFTPLLYGGENLLYEYEVIDNGVFACDVYLNIYINDTLIDRILL